ncbi:MAG: IclR family transcriptional regulator [Bacteroidota bacterium]
MSNLTPAPLNHSVAKAFGVLEYFTPSKPEWGVRELAKELGLNKSTAYRLMATLENLDVLRKDPVSEKYSLGLKLFELGNRVNIQSAFVSQTHPELAKVAAEITETVHLGILKNQQVFMVDKFERPKGLKLNSTIGTSSPIYCSGLGKVLLAFLSPQRQQDILTNVILKANTPFTIVQKGVLKKELKKIAQQGYAIDRQETEIGLICVAVPVFNQSQQMVAALSAAGPANRFREEAIDDYVATLQKGAIAIQNKIGNFNATKF